ncbi:hypothetical protein [Phenylobacterium sp.]|uniref:hypothetical protein n=1 Tax=Phenylobacterium sp. TaxID=1871053 RepID=UPI0035AE2AD3
MAQTQRGRIPTWAAFTAGLAVALLLALAWTGWSRTRGAAGEVDLRIGPAVPDLPAPRMPDAPRLPDAPIPVPK